MRGWIIVLVTIVLETINEGHAACPSQCSGHGMCGSYGVCECDDGWKVAADCSRSEAIARYRRIHSSHIGSCPMGKAWADKAYADNLAHSPVECSGAGVCDRTSGQCQCFSMYTGSACQRSKCQSRARDV